jgi:hypothetical protein
MAWQSLGPFTFTHSDVSTDLGTVVLPTGHDTIWVRMAQVSPQEPWEYSFGLLSWVTADGRDLGTAKAYPKRSGEVFRLGVGLSPVERTGVLNFETRLYNRRWLYAMSETLTLSFEWESGTTSGGGTTAPPSGYAASFVTAAGTGLELARVVFP